MKLTLCSRPSSKRRACAKAASACASNIRLTRPTFHSTALVVFVVCDAEGTLVVPMLRISIAERGMLRKDTASVSPSNLPDPAINKLTVALNGSGCEIGANLPRPLEA